MVSLPWRKKAEVSIAVDLVIVEGVTAMEKNASLSTAVDLVIEGVTAIEK
jgi:hypothetical protein